MRTAWELSETEVSRLSPDDSHAWEGAQELQLHKFPKIVKDREAWHAAVHGVAKSRHKLVTEQQQSFSRDSHSLPGQGPHTGLEFASYQHNDISGTNSKLYWKERLDTINVLYKVPHTVHVRHFHKPGST